MRVLKIEHESASVQFSLVELDALRNALNEARLLLKGREGADFETRVGVDVEHAGGLIKQLQALILQIEDEDASHLVGDSAGQPIESTR